MTTFRDATQEALHNAYHEYKDRHGVFGVVGDMARVQADAVLAMPEMQALRQVCEWALNHGCPVERVPLYLFDWMIGLGEDQ